MLLSIFSILSTILRMNGFFRFFSDDEDIVLKDLVFTGHTPQGKRKLSTYEQNIKGFTDICNLVDVPDEVTQEIFDEGFGDIRRKILAYQHGRTVKKMPHGIASFPNISKIKKPKRQKPPGSPR